MKTAKINTLENFQLYSKRSVMSCGGSWQSIWPTFSFSSCFCTSSGTHLTASAPVRPSSVVLIHVSSELRERKGYWCTLHLVAGLWVWHCQCYCTTVVHIIIRNDIKNGTNLLQIGTAAQRISRLLQRSEGYLSINAGFVHCMYTWKVFWSFA